MKNKNIFLLFILLILIGTIIILNKQSPKQKRIPLFKVNHNDIFMISLSNKQDSLFLVKDLSSDKWNISFPVNRPVNKIKIDDFFKNVLSIKKFNNILTDDMSMYSYYNVTEDTGTRVILYDKNKNIIEDTFFGLADLVSYGAVRKAYDKTVYEISYNVDFSVNPRVSLWRDNNIINFSRINTDSIRVTYSSSQYTLVNDNNQWFYKDSFEKFQVNNAHKAFSRAMNQLENLKTMNYIDYHWDEYQESFKSPILELLIYKKNNTSDRILFTQHTENQCIILVNDDRNTLYIGVYDMVNRFTKSAESYKDIFRYTW